MDTHHTPGEGTAAKNTSPSNNSAAPAPVAKLAYHRDELCQLLGLSVVSLWRIEKRGLLKRIPGVRTPLFSARAVDDFLAGRTANTSARAA